MYIPWGWLSAAVQPQTRRSCRFHHLSTPPPETLPALAAISGANSPTARPRLCCCCSQRCRLAKQRRSGAAAPRARHRPWLLAIGPEPILLPHRCCCRSRGRPRPRAGGRKWCSLLCSNMSAWAWVVRKEEIQRKKGRTLNSSLPKTRNANAPRNQKFKTIITHMHRHFILLNYSMA